MIAEKPNVSVILPSLNVKPFIEECVESVINQTLENIEIICVDAGSDDGTLEILEDYANKDSRIKILRSDKRSYGHQMNLGIAAAEGEYVGILETDDYVEEDMYESLYELSNEGSVDIVKSNFYHFYGDCEFRIDSTKKGLPKNEFTVYENANVLNGHPSIWTGIYKKSFLVENNIKFIEAPGGGWVDNPFLFETHLNAKSIIYKDEPYYYYRELNPNSSTNQLNDLTLPMRRMLDCLDIFEKYNVTDEDVLHAFYFRIFWHIKDTLKKPYFDEQEEEVYHYMQNVLKRLNKDIVLDTFNSDTHLIYYKYLSPLNIMKSDANSALDEENMGYLIDENEFLNSEIALLKKKNKKLKSTNKKLKSEKKKLTKKNKKLDKSIKKIKRSKVYKVGNLVASPIRRIKKFKHNHDASKRMRILFMPSDNNRTSGAFLSMSNLIVNLRKKYPVDIFVILPMKGHGVEVLDSYNIKNYKLIESEDWVVPMSLRKDSIYYADIRKKEEKNKKAITKISKFIRDKNIDLVHINTTYSYVGAEAALNENIPFIWHLREFLEEGQNLTIWDRERGNKLINKANKVITVSDSLYKKYEGVIDSDKLLMIYNGIDATKFYNPDKTIINDELIKFIFVGGFEYHKGQIEFANACVKLYSLGYHNFEVNFVGTGNINVRKEVEEIFSQANMENVKFLGYKKDVENCFKKTDISFTCGSIESFGRTTVEAMLSGNLVIGGNVAGTKELVVDGETGLLYEHGNFDDLCEKMIFAMTNIEKSKEMASAGRKFMIENMTAEINADNIYKVYKEVLKN